MAAVRSILPVSALVFGLVANGCSPGFEPETPLLVAAGPDSFISFEMRASTGEVIWRLEAEHPAPIATLVYAKVPQGFRQTLPAGSPPRPLKIGEGLTLESRIPDRLFLHRAFAKTESTVTVLANEMRRLPSPEHPRVPLE